MARIKFCHVCGSPREYLVKRLCSVCLGLFKQRFGRLPLVAEVVQAQDPKVKQG